MCVFFRFHKDRFHETNRSGKFVQKTLQTADCCWQKKQCTDDLAFEAIQLSAEVRCYGSSNGSTVILSAPVIANVCDGLV